MTLLDISSQISLGTQVCIEERTIDRGRNGWPESVRSRITSPQNRTYRKPSIGIMKPRSSIVASLPTRCRPYERGMPEPKGFGFSTIGTLTWESALVGAAQSPQRAHRDLTTLMDSELWLTSNQRAPQTTRHQYLRTAVFLPAWLFRSFCSQARVLDVEHGDIIVSCSILKYMFLYNTV